MNLVRAALDDPALAAAVAEYRIGKEYVARLKATGLWPGPQTTETYQRKYQIQADIYRDYPEAAEAGYLGIFALDKAETRAHAEELAETWTEEHSGFESLTAEEFWGGVWGRPNHNRDLPDLLLTLIEQECLTPDATRELLADVWVSVEFPGANGGVVRWRDAFDRATSEGGWISDDDSAQPTTPLTLYRGATPEHQRGLSWTADPERARWFAQRFTHGTEQALVYRRTFAPNQLLARFTGRNEDEYLTWIEEEDDVEMDWATP